MSGAAIALRVHRNMGARHGVAPLGHPPLHPSEDKPLVRRIRSWAQERSVEEKRGEGVAEKMAELKNSSEGGGEGGGGVEAEEWSAKI
jgi:hypothetical protein